MIIKPLPDQKDFINSLPFQHVIIDDFLNEKDCNTLLDDFPDKNWELWHRIKSNVQIKYQCREVENFPLSIKILIQKLSSEKFLKDLEKLTGIKKLVPDPYFFSGGIHMIPRGGRLEVHSDFSEAKHLKIFRRLNLILYLNKNWKKEYNGQLELWNKDLSKCEKKILPIFNRCIIFRTDTKSFHGHPEKLNTPEGTFRKSIALYYYTLERDIEVYGYNTRWQKNIKNGQEHSTLKWIRHFFSKILHNLSDKIEKVARKVDKHN